MLILTRREGEQIKIGDNIVVTIIGLRGRSARVGIAAPREVTVNRMEVARRIEAKDESDNQISEGRTETGEAAA